MATFSYIARTGDGTLQKGSINASSAEQAREKLRKKSLLVDELQEEDSGEQIGFTGGMPWTSTDEPIAVPMTAAPVKETVETYAPLLDTVRLFGGWLLAWYALVYLLGSFKMNNKLPVDIPFLDGLFESPLVLLFTFGTFLFLMLSTIHIRTGRGAGKGVALGVLWAVAVILFYLNA